MTAALRITGLTVAGERELLRGVELELPAGGALGLVGESGSGKSLTCRAVMGLLPRGLRRTGGTIETRGRVAMVFQDPLAALDPLMRAGHQVAEVVRRHDRVGRAAARQRVFELFADVALPDPQRIFRAYPHELSGGQRQRVLIALALATRPAVLLCDEPTTALDVTVQREILALLARLRRDLGLAMVFVSHDLAVVTGLCEHLAVLADGRVVEAGPTSALITAPRHPATRRLLDAVLPVPSPPGGGDG